MFSVGRSIVEQISSHAAGLCPLPSLHDGLSTSVRSNVVPEERGSGARIMTPLIDEIGPILVDTIVHSDCFVLLPFGSATAMCARIFQSGGRHTRIAR